jgi:TetR/AcrR family transcriptional regulator, tetracycline repressor protein
MPHPRRVDRRAIVSCAIEILDERGLDNLTLRSIATRLGVRQPGLYHHVGSKAELLDALAEEVLDRSHTDRTPVADEPWDDFVARNARSLRRATLSVRDGARLIASAGSRSPGVDNAIAQVELLEGAGFTGSDAVLALIAVARYTIGAALEQQTARDGGDIVITADEMDPRVDHIVDLARRVVELGQDHEFEIGLSALLRGLDDLRAPSTSARGLGSA